jgi:hypothetical protein
MMIAQRTKTRVLAPLSTRANASVRLVSSFYLVLVRIPIQIDIHSACKSAPVPIEIGTCSEANRHTLFRVS